MLVVMNNKEFLLITGMIKIGNVYNLQGSALTFIDNTHISLCLLSYFLKPI